jgi:hypothetical protein
LRPRISLYTRRTVLALLLCTAALGTAHAQEQTFGLFVYDSNASPGYTLFAPIGSRTTYLIDMGGHLINSWSSLYRPGFAVYLLENGDLLRASKDETFIVGGGEGGRVQQFTWDGTLIWDYPYNTDGKLQHHDIEPLPNGNVLLPAWERKSAAEAIAAGRNPALLDDTVLYPDHIVEVQPTGPTTGDIVWEWHAWDHMIQDFDSGAGNFGIVRDHPELIDINSGTTHQDWLHCNAIDYNPEFDQIIISAHGFSEFWIIDHSTTTPEAADHTGGNSGRGGDLLYRWGNPQAYDAGDASDQKLFQQHDARWIPAGYPGAGDITAFNNGRGRPGGQHSSVDEIIPPVDGSGNYMQPPPGVPYDPAEQTWIYKATPASEWYQSSISSAHRLANGNTLICSGQESRLFEVTTDSQVVWEYRSPINHDVPWEQGETGAVDQIFRCHRYPPDYPGFSGRDLTPGSALEVYPITISGTSHSPQEPLPDDSVIVTTNVTGANPISLVQLHADFGSGPIVLPMSDDGNHHDGSASDGQYGAAIQPGGPATAVSYYVHVEDNGGEAADDPPNPPSTRYWYFICCVEPAIVINELMAANQTCCPDEYGDFDDWIELYNPEPVDLELGGMYLTNDLNDPTRFQIGDTVIPALGHIVFTADNEIGEGITHTNFVLDPVGGEVGLYDSDAWGNRVLDSVTYASQSPESSFGRMVDGGSDWESLGTPTPGFSNLYCGCPHQCDLDGDDFYTALDLGKVIDILFAGDPDISDPFCPNPRADFDCDGFSTALDLSALIDLLFVSGDPPCDPCHP